MGLMLKTLDALMFGGCEMGTISKSSSPKPQTDIKPSISNLVRITSNSPFPIPAAHPCETPGGGERFQGCDPAVAGDPRDLLKTSDLFDRGYSEKGSRGSTIFNQRWFTRCAKKNWVSCHLPWFTTSRWIWPKIYHIIGDICPQVVTLQRTQNTECHKESTGYELLPWRRKIGILYQSISWIRECLGASNANTGNPSHIASIPMAGIWYRYLRCFHSSGVGTSVAVTWCLCTSRPFAAMRRCPTGGTDDFGGCWRSRNSIHIYIYISIYIYMCIYIYIYIYNTLWPSLTDFGHFPRHLGYCWQPNVCKDLNSLLFTDCCKWLIHLQPFDGFHWGNPRNTTSLPFQGSWAITKPMAGFHSSVEMHLTYTEILSPQLPLTGHRAAVGLRRGSKHQHGGGWRMGCWACYWMLLGTMMMMVCLDRAPMETQRFLIVDTPQMSGSSASLVWSPSIWPRPRSTRW